MEYKKLVLEVKQQSATFLSDFMKLIVSFEIPLVAIDSQSHYAQVYSTKDGVVDLAEKAHFTQVSMPAVKSTFVLEVLPFQAQEIANFVKLRKKFCTIVVMPEFK